MNQRFFFAQDCDSHWYLIPEALRATWEKMTRNDPDIDDSDWWGDFDALFEKHRIGWGISGYSFENPQGRA